MRSINFPLNFKVNLDIWRFKQHLFPGAIFIKLLREKMEISLSLPKAYFSTEADISYIIWKGFSYSTYVLHYVFATEFVELFPYNLASNFSLNLSFPLRSFMNMDPGVCQSKTTLIPRLRVAAFNASFTEIYQKQQNVAR